MQAVLGIDAAWTDTQPSGVAVATGEGGRWQLHCAHASYGAFLAQADPQLAAAHPGHAPDAEALLQAGAIIAGRPIDLIAIDMPLARSKITGRREADNAVSRAYGRQKCGTHSPSSARPGSISDTLRAELERAGYRLCLTEIRTPGLIEVYPHPALVNLTGSAERLPYKLSRTRSYWKDADAGGRWQLLLCEWRRIIEALDREIDGVRAHMPPVSAEARGRDKKAYEDRIDAIVCAWTAIQALSGCAQSYGDEDATIWIPRRPITLAAEEFSAT